MDITASDQTPAENALLASGSQEGWSTSAMTDASDEITVLIIDNIVSIYHVSVQVKQTDYVKIELLSSLGGETLAMVCIYVGAYV